MTKRNYAVEFLVLHRVVVEDVPSADAARERATRFIAQHHAQHTLRSVEELPAQEAT